VLQIVDIVTESIRVDDKKVEVVCLSIEASPCLLLEAIAGPTMS
jgi:hypothetical protein